MLYLFFTVSEVRLILLGDSWSEKRLVGNLILGETNFNSREEPGSSIRIQKIIHEKKLVVINTPDLLYHRISEEKLKGQVEICLRFCASVPHLFLLVVQPDHFTEEQKKKFYKILELFGGQSYELAIVTIISNEMDINLNQDLQDLIRRCRGNSFILKDNDRKELLRKIGDFLDKRNEIYPVHQSSSIKHGKETCTGRCWKRCIAHKLHIIFAPCHVQIFLSHVISALQVIRNKQG